MHGIVLSCRSLGRVLIHGLITHQKFVDACHIVMRARHLIVALAVILVVFGAKALLSPAHLEGDTLAAQGASMDVLRMHIDYPNMNNLPVHQTNDMTLVFAGND